MENLHSSLRWAEYRSFAELPADCRQLLLDAEEASVFLGLTWFEAFAATLVDDGWRLRLFVFLHAAKNGQAVAIIPLWQKIGSRHIESLSNYYSSLYAPVIAKPLLQQAPLLAALFEIFLSQLVNQDKLISLNLHPIAYPAPWVDVLCQVAKAQGLYAQRYFCFGNWYLELGGRQAKQYFSSLPSRLRNTLKRKHNQVKANVDCQVRIVTRSEELAQAYLHYRKIYANSWKGEESHPAFIEKMLNDFAHRGQLRLGILEINGEAAAAQFWLLVYDQASIYKLAYDEKFARYSVGSLLTEAMFTQLIDQDKVTEVDFLSGDDTYKKDWMSHRRQRYGLLIINRRSITGFALYCRHAIPAKLKNWLGKSWPSTD